MNITIPTTADFWLATQYFASASLFMGLLTAIAFGLNWGFRFRLVGITGFMIVLTGGAFGLSVVPFIQSNVPGSVPFEVTYDNGLSQAVISVSPTISETELEATLLQAASNLFSLGRSGSANEKFLIRARTILHKEPGLSVPLYLGDVQRSLAVREDQQMVVTLYDDAIAQLPEPEPEETTEE
ncbi:MAG: Ycf51 family protein [Cyanobacteria bacterium P01_F01_bin.150]